METDYDNKSYKFKKDNTQPSYQGEDDSLIDEANRRMDALQKRFNEMKWLKTI